MDPNPPIDHSCTLPYYTRSVVYVEGCRCTHVKWTPIPPANQNQLYRAQLHHINFTWVRMQTCPGQMWPAPCQLTPAVQSPNTQVSCICGSMQMYTGQMDPPPQLTPVVQCPTTPGDWKCGSMQTYPGQMDPNPPVDHSCTAPYCTR